MDGIQNAKAYPPCATHHVGVIVVVQCVNTLGKTKGQKGILVSVKHKDILRRHFGGHSAKNILLY